MGVKERRTREREELRQRILMAARAIAREESWQALTMRKVAERIEYTPPTLYEYFASKDAMMEALLEEGYRLLLEDIIQVRQQPGTLEATMIGIGLAYWEFAWRYPELYQVMYGLDGVPFCEEHKPAIIEQVMDVVIEVLRAFEASGAMIASPDDTIDMMRAALHGLIALTMAGRIEGGQERARRLAEGVLQSMIQSWQVASQHAS